MIPILKISKSLRLLRGQRYQTVWNIMGQPSLKTLAAIFLMMTRKAIHLLGMLFMVALCHLGWGTFFLNIEINKYKFEMANF